MTTLFNIFLYLSTRERVYFYYFSFILTGGLFGFARRGFGFQYLWPNSTALQEASIPLLLSLFMIFSLLFTSGFLQFKRTMPLAQKLCWNLEAAFVIPVIALLLGNYSLAVQMGLFLALLVGIPIVMIIPPILAYRGQPAARHYTAAFAVLILACLVQILKTFNIVPTIFFTENAMLIGSALQVILLSPAVALRLQALQREQIKAELRAQKILTEAAQTRMKLLETEKRAQEERENYKKFAINTHNLVKLGKLSATLSHEVRNPAQSVLLSLSVANNLIDNIEQLIRKQIEISTSEGQSFYDVYLPQETSLRQMIQNSLKAIRSLSEITTTMTRQSTVDDSQVKTIDINRLIDESIMLTQAKIHDVQLTFNRGVITPINTMPVQLTQVLMNLISNAVDALEHHRQTLPEDTKKTFTSIIEIVTQTKARAQKLGIMIQIKDNGGGIPEDVIAHIFEEFYTTKKLDAGTGLGLYLAQKYIEENHGKIVVRNNPDFGGAEFTIWLPASGITD